jgi:hypothetical protein
MRSLLRGFTRISHSVAYAGDLLSYLVIASPVPDERERRFEYTTYEPLGHEMTFTADGIYKVWRVVADDSGRYDGLVDAELVRRNG